MSLSKESCIFAATALFFAVALSVSLVFNFMQENTAPEKVKIENHAIANTVDIIPEKKLELLSSGYRSWSNTLSLQFNTPVNAGELAKHIDITPAVNNGIDIYPADYSSSLYTFAPAFRPETMYRVTVRGGLADSGGTMFMDNDRNINIITPPVSPELSLLTGGRIFPPAGRAWSLPFSYRKLEKVTFTLYEGYANNQHTSATQSYYMSRKVAETEVTLPEPENDEEGFFDLDLDLLLPERNPGFYILNAEGENLWGRTFPLTVSDIGISGAVAPQKALASIHSLSDGTPIAGARVQLISAKKQELAEGESDADGNVTLWYDLSEDPGDYPELFKVYYLNDCNTLPCFYSSSALNMSEFDLSGAPETDTVLRAKVQPVRELIRPGESIRVIMLLRDTLTGGAPGAQPVGAAVYDTNGKIMQREVLDCTETGFAGFDFHLPAGSPQGTYTIYAGQPGNEQEICYGTASVISADFKPDTAQIILDDNDSAAAGYAGYFFGQPLAGTPVNVRFNNSYSRFAPEGFPGFVFGVEPSNEVTATNLNGKTTEAGRFSFLLPAAANAKPANAVLKQLATVTVNPGASRPVSATKEFTRHVDRSYLGALVTAVSPGTLKINWISIDGNLDTIPMECDRLDWQLEKMEWEYSFVSTYNKIRRQWVQRRYPAGAGTAEFESGAVSGNFTIPCPAGDSNFLLTLTDPVTGMQCIREVCLINEDAGIRSGNRMIIPFTSDAAEYAPGTTARVSFELDAPGSVTVMSTADEEKNVYELPGTAGTNTFEYTIPQETVSGSIRLAFTVLTPDPSGIEEIRRSFGIAVINVDQSARKIKISADIPAETLPGARIFIPVQTDRGADTEIRAWAVNSGTLALTGMKETGFFKHFHGTRENLWDFYDCYSDLYPMFSLEGSSIPGGDAMLKALRNFTANNQPPEDHGDIIAIPVITDGEGRSVIILDVPETESCEYTIFIAAGNDDAIGESTGKFLVRRSITPVLSGPGAAAGGDTFDAVLEIFNNKSDDPVIDWEITAAGPATPVSGEFSGRENVEKGSSIQRVVTFKAAENAGEPCIITATASNNGRETTAVHTVILRPAVLPETRFATLSIPAGESVEIPSGTDGLTKVISTSVTAGSLHGTNLGSRLEWLNNYPYGCSEQLISRALPQLAVAPMIKLGILPESFAPGAIDNISEIMDILRTRQNSRGGIRMWYNDMQVSPDVSVYCGFLLTAAAERGLKLPEGMLDNICRYLENDIMKSSGTATLERRALAGLVLAKAGRKCTPLILSTAYESGDAGQPFAMAICGYALCISGNGEEGLRFFRKAMADKPWLTGTGSDSCWSGQVRRAGILLAAASELTPEDEISLHLAQVLEETAPADSATTQEMAWSAFALAEYALRIKTGSAAFAVTDSEGTKSFAAGEQALLRLNDGENITIRNDGPGDIAVRSVVRGIPAEMQECADGIQLTRRFIDSNGVEITEISRGDLFIMEISLTSLAGYHDDIVIAALLPGGIEAEDARFVTRDTNGTATAKAPYHSELQADRVIIFDSARPEGTVIHIPVRAVSRGTFSIPAIVAEDMYNPEVKAVLPATGTFLQVK